MADYPEHEKQAAVLDRAQVIGEFLDWLREQSIKLYLDNPQFTDGPIDTWEDTEQMVARYLAEAEKRAMLEEAIKHRNRGANK